MVSRGLTTDLYTVGRGEGVDSRGLTTDVYTVGRGEGWSQGV